MRHEFRRQWTEVRQHDYLFDRKARSLDTLKDITLEQVVHYYDGLFSLDSACRRLEVMVTAACHQES